jgi:hypothetical protein
MVQAIQSFVVRIWIEETAEEDGGALWRGHITHVASKKRGYLSDLDQLSQFIIPYLREMGVQGQALSARPDNPSEEETCQT